jgi:hypothetical protein
MVEDLMDADWSVELGSDDGALEFPWSSPDGRQRYFDLRGHPEQLAEIPEAVLFPELGELLHALNAPPSPWFTAKCDVWTENHLDAAEAIHDATLKLCSYVDLIFRADDTRFSFDRHEQWVKSAARELSNDVATSVACEFIVRRCWYRPEVSPLREFEETSSREGENTVPGFCITFYLLGYGNTESEARERWAAGLRQVTPVLLALAA